MTIDDWFSGDKNFNTGVALYRQLSTPKPHVLRQLDKGYSRRSFSLLVSELRKARHAAPTRSIVPPAPPKPKPVNPLEGEKLVSEEAKRKKLADTSLQKNYGGIKYNNLPPDLKVRYRENVQLFYQKCDLKDALNRLPSEAEDDARRLVFAIDDLDERQRIIWKELQHWQDHRTHLPKEGSDFSGFTPVQLLKAKSNTRSQIKKLDGRIEGYYEKLFTESDSHQKKLIEQQIQRSESRKHQHELNLIKINELI